MLNQKHFIYAPKETPPVIQPVTLYSKSGPK